MSRFLVALAALLLSCGAEPAREVEGTSPIAGDLAISSEQEAREAARRITRRAWTIATGLKFELSLDLPEFVGQLVEVRLDEARARTGELLLQWRICGGGGLEDGDDCVYDDQKPPYTQVIPLARIDPEWITVTENGGGLFHLVGLLCAGEPTPAECVAHTFSGEGQPGTLHREVGFLVCGEKSDCDPMREDLEALVLYYRSLFPPESARSEPARPASEIVGVWELFVPAAKGVYVLWTLEFNADDTYRFTDASNGNRHQGTYRAVDGRWSLDGKWTKVVGLAPGTPFNDSGTYRLLSPDSLEFVGRLGPATWKRSAGS